MKNLFFTAIFLVVLCTTLTLYLEYKNRSFIEALPTPHAPATRSISSADGAITLESHESAITATSLPAPTIVNTITENSPPSVQEVPQTGKNALTETAENPFEDLIFEEHADDLSDRATEEVLLENQELASTEKEAHRRAVETMDRLTRDSSNLIYGGAGEPVSVYLMSGGEGQAFLEASSLLETPSEDRRSNEISRDVQDIWNQIPSVIEVDGMEIHFFPSDAP